MKLCRSCSRFLRADASACPFCQAKSPLPSAQILALSLAAGLAVSGCAGDDGETTETTVSTSDATTTTTTMTTTTTTTTAMSDDSSMSVAAYGSPPDSTGESTAGDGNDEPADDESPEELSADKP